MEIWRLIFIFYLSICRSSVVGMCVIGCVWGCVLRPRSGMGDLEGERSREEAEKYEK